MGSPILIYQPGGGSPIPVPFEPPLGHVAGEDGIAPLIEDQSYVDVVFSVAQPRSDWTFIECRVLNTVDSEPLNIWPGIVTDKSRTGFTLQLNGLPDSSNYYLSWSISGATTGTAGVAESYLFSGPVSGPIGLASTFVVALPAGMTLDEPITIIPDDGGAGGAFSPTIVELSAGVPTAYFTYTPVSYGTKTISVNDDAGLADPAILNFMVTAATYTLSGPSSGSPGEASTNFTVALPVDAVVTSTVTIIPGDGGGGGTFTPTIVTLTTAAPSVTFTYTPASTGAKTISVTNNRGLTNPGSLTYTVTAPTYSLSGPSSGVTGSPSADFTVTLAASPLISGTVVVTPSDGGDGGTFTPTTVSVTDASPIATFTYTAATDGTKTISVTNNRGLTNPANLTYVAAVPHLLNTLISYWKMDEAYTGSPVTRVDSHGSNNLSDPAPSSAFVVTGKINSCIGINGPSGQYLEHADNASLQVTGDFTFSCWVNLQAQDDYAVISKSNWFAGNRDYMLLYYSSASTDGFSFYVNTAFNGTDSAKVGAVTATGVWTHIVAWYDSVAQRVYLRINDTTTYASTTAATTATSGQPFRIGAMAAAPPEYFTGWIDEVGFWKRKLTSGEITALYNGGSALAYSSFTA